MQLLIFVLFAPLRKSSNLLNLSLTICLLCNHMPRFRILCFVQQQLNLSAGRVKPVFPFGWWAQMDFLLFGASHQVATPFNP